MAKRIRKLTPTEEMARALAEADGEELPPLPEEDVPEAEQPQVEYLPDVGAVETFVRRGAAALPLGKLVSNSLAAGILAKVRGASGGTRAVIPPAARAELEAMGEEVRDGGLVDTYREVRDEGNLREEVGRQINPNAARAGTVVGLGASVLAPFLPAFRYLPKGGEAATRAALLAARVKSGAATGAAYGALGGATDGQADLTRGDVGGTLRDTVEGGAWGGALGAGLATGVEGARALAPYLKALAIRQGRQALQSSSDLGAYNREPVSDGAVENAITKGLIPSGANTQKIYELLEREAAKEGATLGGLIDKMEAAGVKGPNVRELAQRFLSRYDDVYANSGADKGPANIFRREAQNVENLGRRGSLSDPDATNASPSRQYLSFSQTERIKRAVQDKAYNEKLRLTGRDKAAQEAADMYQLANEEAALAAGQGAAPGSEVADLAARFKPQKRQTGLLIEARETAKRGAAKEKQRQPVGLKAQLLTANDNDGAVVRYLKALGAQAAFERGPSLIANEGYTLAEALRTGRASGNVGRAGQVAVGLADQELEDWRAQAEAEEDPNVAERLSNYLRRRAREARNQP